MNVLELCLSPGLGGLELYTYRASVALNENHTVTAVLLDASKLDTQFKKHSEIDRLHLTKSINPAPLFNARKLAKIIDSRDIDIIHMHWGKDFALAALAKSFSDKKPALVYTRQMMITRAKNDFYHNFLYGQMDLMLTITKELESLAKSFISHYARKITTLYYGVKQPDEFLDQNTINKLRHDLGFPDNGFVVGLIGRLEESKGQHLLIEAINQASKNGHTISALIVGHEMNNGYRDTLREQACKLGVADNIVFQEFTNNPQQLMQLCDCIVLASNQETFGLVLPEAMRCGVAVVGSNSGGVPEIIDHQKTGLLFETGDSHSLHEAILMLYKSPELKISLSSQGKDKADKVFNEHEHFKKLEQHLQSTNS